MRKYVAYFWKNCKYNDIIRDPNCLSDSVKFALSIQAIDGVRKSEDYNILDGQRQVEVQRMWADLSPFALGGHDLNRCALCACWDKSYSCLLAKAAFDFLTSMALKIILSTQQ